MFQINHKRNEKAENPKIWGKDPKFITLEFFLKTDFRKIRDKPNRMCRKASTAPDQAFIVEEALLEDLCAIAGEEAHDGGNIIM